MFNVLAVGRYHRGRRVETFNNPPKGIKFIRQDVGVVKDHEANLRSVNRSLVEKAKDFLRFGNLIPKKDLEGVDLIYSCGKVILNDFPFVVEIDNIACLSYYNLKCLKLLKPLIRARLRNDNCKKIICISEAGKKSVIMFFKDKVIEDKIVVVYPFIKKQKKVRGKDDRVRLLYVSRAFYLKGGKEILKAYKKLKVKYPFIELTIVSDWFPAHTEGLDDVRIVSPTMSKQRLYDEFYCTHDVFLQLSYQDSFGLATLEAVACGLPVICTDMFALPELVRHGFNGFVIDSPIEYFKNFLPNKKFWGGRDLNRFARDHEFSKLQNNFEFYLERLINDKVLRDVMSKNAFKLIDECFSEEKRKKLLKEALMKNE